MDYWDQNIDLILPQELNPCFNYRLNSINLILYKMGSSKKFLSRRISTFHFQRSNLARMHKMNLNGEVLENRSHRSMKEIILIWTHIVRDSNSRLFTAWLWPAYRILSQNTILLGLSGFSTLDTNHHWIHAPSCPNCFSRPSSKTFGK